MKRKIAAALTLSLLAGLTGCHREPFPPVTAPTTETEPTTVTESTAETEPTTVTEPATQPGELVFDITEYSHFEDILEQLENESGAFTVNGLCTPVTLEVVDGNLESIEAWDQILYPSIDAWPYTGLFGNVSPVLNSHGDKIILNIWDEDQGYTAILTPRKIYEAFPQYGTSVMVYVNADKELAYSRFATCFLGIDQWDTGPIDTAVSRDQFHFSEGIIYQWDDRGTDYSEPKAHTISDSYDLDAIFAEAKKQGQYEEYETLDALLERNRLNTEPILTEEQKQGVYLYEDRDSNGILRKHNRYCYGVLISALVYDEMGRLLHETGYDYQGERYHYEYSYDHRDNIISTDFNENSPEGFRLIHTYDENDHLLETVRYVDGKETERFVYEYDQKGNRIRETFSQNGVEKYSYGFNARGELTEHITYWEGEAIESGNPGKLVKAQLITDVYSPVIDTVPFTYHFTYDGTQLLSSDDNEGGEVNQWFYNGSYRCPSRHISLAEEGIVEGIYSYDDQDRLTQMLLTLDGAEIVREVYTYTEGVRQTVRYEDGKETDRYVDDGTEADEDGYEIDEEYFSCVYDRDGMLSRVTYTNQELCDILFHYHSVYVTEEEAEALAQMREDILAFLC